MDKNRYEIVDGRVVADRNFYPHFTRIITGTCTKRGFRGRDSRHPRSAPDAGIPTSKADADNEGRVVPEPGLEPG
jgi:hypothetical protein